MKSIGISIAMTLMLVMATTAFAKMDTLNKRYDAISHAKAMHTQKVIKLQHPEKMGKLRKQYAQIRESCRKGTTQPGMTNKAAFYRKANRQTGMKHDCPYKHGMPSTTPQAMGAKEQQAMKCKRMQQATPTAPQEDCCRK